VQDLDGPTAAAQHPGRDLFCGWPASDENWLVPTLGHLDVGKHLFFLGEAFGSVTGSEETETLLKESGCYAVADVIDMPVLGPFKDWMTIFRKIREH
jgi:hypothetical protein